MIKNNKDIPAGAIVTSTKGTKYLVLVDDAGQRGLYTKTGTWMRFVGDTLTFGKNGDSTVKSVQIFDTLPTLDAISEGIKMIYTGRPACAKLTEVYSLEPDYVTEARKAMDCAMAEVEKAKSIIERYERGF